MNKLINLGFVNSAYATLINGDLSIEITANRFSRNILYAFVVINEPELSDWHVRYIGHSRKTFENRMYGYELGNGVAVNNRIHNELIELLQNGREVVVYCLPDIFNMNLHGLHIDISAGLEYALIDYYCTYNFENNHPPLQNIAGNRNYNAPLETVQQLINVEQTEEEMQYVPIVIQFPVYNILSQFNQDLSKSTYWDSTNINVPVRLTNYFSNHDDTTTLSIVEGGNLINQFTLRINRTANSNGAPRFYISGDDGIWFQNWKHNRFTQNDQIQFNIIEQNHIAIIRDNQ